MTFTEDSGHHRDDPIDWARLGRAAEELAHHVARDAARFAQRIEEHAKDFARDLGREWRRNERRRHSFGCESDAQDMHRVFADVRSLLDDVLNGVDDLIDRLFPERRHEHGSAPENDAASWTPIVTNRDATCGSCHASIAPGSEAFLRKTEGPPEFRCSLCGPGDSSQTV